MTRNSANSAELLRRFLVDRCEASFRELVRQEIDFVHSTAVRVAHGNEMLAKDVTQLVFIDLIRNSKRLAGATVITGWLYRSTVYAAKKALRTESRWKARQKAAASEIESEAALPDSPAEVWESVQPVLDERMSKLNQRDQRLLLALYFQQRAVSDISRDEGITENALRMRAARALERLRSHFARRGLKSTGAVLAAAIQVGAVKAAPHGLASSLAGSSLATAALMNAGSSAIPPGVGHWYNKLLLPAAIGASLTAILIAEGFHQHPHPGNAETIIAAPMGAKDAASALAAAAPRQDRLGLSKRLSSGADIRAAIRQVVANAYARFTKEHNLSDSQADLLIELLTDQRLIGEDLQVQLDASTRTGDERADANLAWKRNEALIEQLLGSGGVQAIKDYDRAGVGQETAAAALTAIDPGNSLPEPTRQLTSQLVARYDPNIRIGDFIGNRQPIDDASREHLLTDAAARFAPIATALGTVLPPNQIAQLKQWAVSAVDAKIGFANTVIANARKWAGQ